MKIKFLLGVLSMWAISTSALAQWVVQNSGLPPSEEPTLIFSAVSPEVCWGIQSKTMNPVIVKTLDGGDTWEQIKLADTLLEGRSIFAMSADTAWITLNDRENGENGGIWKTTDGGESWVKHDSVFTGPGSHPAKIHFFDSINGLCTGSIMDEYWEIYTTQDGGTTWSRVPSQNIPAPDYTGDYTSGETGCGVDSSFWFTTSASLYRSTDMGLTWSVSDSIPLDGFEPSDVAFKDSLNGLLTAFHHYDWHEENNIFSSSDGGITWTLIQTEFTDPSVQWLNYVPGTSGTYFVTSNYLENSQLVSLGGSAYTTNDGLDWIVIDGLEHGKAEFVDSTTGWCAGRGDIIFKWTSGSVGIDEDAASSRNNVTLGQNYPNPFNSSTTIQYKIPSASNVVIKVYNVHGSEVATLENGRKSQGTYSVKFGSSVLSSGIYYYRLQVGDNIQTRKLVKF